MWNNTRLRWNVTIVCALAALLMPVAVSVSAERHALVFGLGKQEDTRWARIHGDNDVFYVKQMLYRMGYTNIRTLVNEQATKQAMVDAFVSLALQCGRGDEVYIHYSGHGQLMTDLDGDEALKWTGRHRGWDEAWIPYDAYLTYGPEDHGEKHLCDDEVALFLQAIRKKIGRHGRLIVVVDACHSGDATAGRYDNKYGNDNENDNGEECVRGVDTKFNMPRNPDMAQVVEPTVEQWLTISACKPYQLCTEIKDKQVGKLTFALYSIGEQAFDLNNKQLESVLKRFMEQYRGRLPQTPMVTGKGRE